MLIFILLVTVIIIAAYFILKNADKDAGPLKSLKPMLNEELSQELAPGKFAQWIDDPPLYLDERIPMVHLLLKDPHWIYAYWSWGVDTAKTFQLHYGSGSWEKSTPVLRYQEVETDTSFDIFINDYARSWYFQPRYPNTTAKVFLGRILDGQFIQMANSNLLPIPHPGPSPEVDPQWQPVFSILPYHQEVGVHLKDKEVGGTSSIGLSSWSYPSRKDEK